MSSRKDYLITRIALERSMQGMSTIEAQESVQGYYRKKVDELIRISQETFAKRIYHKGERQ